MVAFLFVVGVVAVLALVLFGIRWYAEHSLGESERIAKYDGENHVR
jgi:hypothetical protein